MSLTSQLRNVMEDVAVAAAVTPSGAPGGSDKSPSSPTPTKDPTVFTVGDKIEALWGGRWWPAQVEAAKPSNLYDVKYRSDGTVRKNRRTDEIRHVGMDASPAPSPRNVAEVIPPDNASAATFFGDVNAAHFQRLGGEDGVLKIARQFHGCSNDETHAQHFVWYFMMSCGVSDLYLEKRRGFFTPHEAHTRAGGNFTNSQRLAWKADFLKACVDVAHVRLGMLQDMTDWVDRMMFLYGPFADDR